MDKKQKCALKYTFKDVVLITFGTIIVSVIIIALMYGLSIATDYIINTVVLLFPEITIVINKTNVGYGILVGFIIGIIYCIAYSIREKYRTYLTKCEWMERLEKGEV